MADEPVRVSVGDDHVAEVRLNRPPNNFFSLRMIEGVAEALESLDGNRRKTMDKVKAIGLANAIAPILVSSRPTRRQRARLRFGPRPGAYELGQST